jgi:glycosyltransferase involved in cell wall biosynthesis
MTEVSIVLCTFNEEKFIGTTLDLVKAKIKNAEIIVVDDNSSDKTVDIIKKKKKKNKNIKLIQRTKIRGLASAFVIGLMNTSGKYVGWLDTNMGYVLKYFPLMEKSLKNNNDLVLLSRYVPKGTDERHLLRTLSSKLLNFFCRLYLTNKINDFSSGIFLMKKDILNEIVPFGYGHGEFFIEFIYRLSKTKFKIKEIAYTQKKDSVPGNSKTAPNIFQFIKLAYIYFMRIIVCKNRIN